jgi:hypothetical protein
VGIEQPRLEVVLEQGVHWLPVDPRRLHAHDGDAEGGQPVAQDQQAGRGRAEGLGLLVARAVLAGYPHAGGDRVLVDVESAQRSIIRSTASLLSVARRSLLAKSLSCVLVATVKGA